jgi:hypothetical protein
MRGKNNLDPCPLATIALRVVHSSPQVSKQALLELPPHYRALLRIKPIFLDEFMDVVWTKLKQNVIDDLMEMIDMARSFDEVLMCRREYPRPTEILTWIAYWNSLRFNPAVYPLNPDYPDE